MFALSRLFKFLVAVLKGQEHEQTTAPYPEFFDFDKLYTPGYGKLAHAYRANSGQKASSEDGSDAEEDLKNAVVYNNLGMDCRKRHDYGAAIANYTKALELNPSYVAAYNNRGNAYRASGNLDAAIADYTQAIELNPTDTTAYGNRGIAFGTKNDLNAATADCTKVIEINPADGLAYFNRGVTNETQGKIQAAIADVETAAKLFRQQGNTAHHQRAIDLLGELYEKRIETMLAGYGMNVLAGPPADPPPVETYG
jgi:tetratricopeptide (TPR) repeat protein